MQVALGVGNQGAFLVVAVCATDEAVNDPFLSAAR